MKRIFTAIDISDEARRKASNYIETLKRAFPNLRVGWDKPEKLHFTLKFLGDMDEKHLDDLTAAVEKTAKQISEFKLQVTGTGVFPSKRNARILWLGVKDESGSLQKLNEALEIECEKFGFAKEKRNFKPHLTVARLREPKKSKDLIEEHLRNEFDSNEFIVAEIVIYESRLQKTGSIYSVVSTHELEEKLSTDKHR